MTIFRYALLRAMRNPLNLIATYLLPVALIFIRPVWTENAGVFSGFAFLALIIMSSAYLSSLSILTDKADGVIVRILSAPITMRRYLAENLLSCMVPLFVQISLISVLGAILYDWGATLSIAVFLCYTVLTLASVAMAFAWHCLFKGKEGNVIGFTMVLFLTAFLGGMTFPVEAFPGPLQYVGALFPAYWALRALRLIEELGTMSGEYWLAIAAMALFTIAFLLYGGKRRIV